MDSQSSKRAREKAPAQVRPGLNEADETVRGSGLEGVVGFAVVGEIADAVHGVFEEGRDGEDREANGRAGEGADEEEREAGGFAEEAEDAEGFGGHMRWQPCQQMPAA